MKTVWAPWRIEYITADKEEGCIFCNALADQGDLTLYKGKITMVMMNKFPYNSGHLLIIPKRHLQGLDQLSVEENCDLSLLIKRSVEVMKKVMLPEGFNIGLNMGKAAGAGIEEHLHYHIVPRWNGDLNFITVMDDIRVVPEHMQKTYERLKPHFEEF